MIIIITIIIIIIIIIIIKNSIHGYKKIVTIFEPTHQLFFSFIIRRRAREYAKHCIS